MRIKKADVALLDGDPAFLTEDAEVLLLPVGSNHLILLADQLAEVQAEFAAGEAGVARFSRVVQQLGSLDQVLGG